ncbi:hypothetical protein NC651_016401 [Populus alba x Populus x berolinensis]|nr:hypothetical protein NC651_016401 [Populus alba x Populus x berolinensis]
MGIVPQPKEKYCPLIPLSSFLLHYYLGHKNHLLTKFGPQLKGDLITMELPFGASTIATRERCDYISSKSSKNPVDYAPVWSRKSLQIKQEGIGYISLPTSPDGYKAPGHVVTNSPEKPFLEKVRCVRSELTNWYNLGNVKFRF